MNTSNSKNGSSSNHIPRKLLSVLLSILMFVSIVPMGVLSFVSHAITPYKTSVDVYDNVKIVETITQYRYRTKSTTTSRETSLSGWTRNGGSWQLSSTNSFNYASFPDGFDTSNSIYTSFHKSCDVSSYTNETSKREVSTSSAGYVYYKWDYNAQYANRTDRAISHIRRTSGTSGWAYIYFHANLSSTAHPYLDNYYCNDANLPSYNCSSEFNTTDLAGPTPRFFRFSYSTCTYRDYYMLFNYYKWSDWSSWSDTAVSATSDREVETRTLKVDEYGIRYSSDLKTIYSVPVGLECNVFNIPSGVETIETSAFENCTKIKSVNFPSTLKTIAARGFNGCTALEEIFFPENITTIGSLSFTGCTSLVAVYFHHKRPPQATSPFANTGLTCIYVYFLDLKDAWLEYESSWMGFPLKSYNPPGQLYSDINSNNTDDQGLTYSYDSTTNTATVIGFSGSGDVIIPRRIVKNNVSYYVKSFNSDVFSGNASLTSVSITKDITSIPAHAFKNCTGLTGIYYEGVLSSLGSEAFYGCSNLTSFDYLNTLTSIPDRAFYNCNSLRNISLPSTLTSIGDSAFYGCSAYGDISIPSKTTTIGANAFSGCSNTVTVTFNGTVNSVGNAAFGNCANLTKANFKSNPPTNTGSNIFTNNSNFFVSYPTNNSSWNSQVSNYQWKGYLAYNANMISQVGDGSSRPWIIRVVNYKGFNVRGATVTVNGVSKTTDSEGCATFALPTGSTAAVSVNPNNIDYEFLINNNYSINKRQTIALITLGAHHSISAVTVNGTNVFTSHIPFNVNYTGYSTFSVRVRSPLKITKLEIVSGNTVVAKKTNITSGTYSININNRLFAAYSNVLVRMTTEDGKTIQKTLNISTFKTNASDFSLSASDDPKFELSSSGVDLLKGVSISIPVKSWLNEAKVEIENTQTTVKFKINSPELTKNISSKLKVSGGINGSVEIGYNVNTHSIYIVKYSVSAYGKISFKHDQDFVVFSIPLTVEIKLSGKLTLSFETGSTYTSNGRYSVSCKFKATVTIEGKLSLGLGNKLVSAGIYGGVKFDWEIPSKVFASGSAGVYIKLVCMRHDMQLWNWEKTQIWPRGRSIAKLSPNISDFYDESKLSPIERNYLEYRSNWMNSGPKKAPVRTSTETTYSNSVLQTFAYEYIDPQIISYNDKIIMLYADDIATRSVENMQALVYSVYDSSSNIWSTPKPVNDTGMFDNRYQLYTDGTDVYVVYTSANKEFQSGASIEEICTAMDVNVAKYNTDTDSFDVIGRLSNDTTYDMFADIAVVNGVPTVAWVSNESGNAFGMDQTNSVLYSQFVDGTWTAPVSMANGLNLVSDVAVGTLNGSLAIAAVIDTDSDPSTFDDSTAILLSDTNTVKEIGRPGYNNSIQFVEYNNQNVLVWNDSGMVRYITDSEGEIRNVLTDEESNIAADFRWVDCGDGKYAITYVVPDEEEGSDVYTVYYDGTNWTSPIRVTNTDHYIGAYDAAYVNDRFIIPYRDTDVTFTDDSFTTTANLCVAQIIPANDLYVTDAVIDRSDMVLGETGTVNVTVFNNGFNNVDEATIIIKDAADNTICSSTQALGLRSGEAKSIDVDFTVPSEVTDGSYTIYVLTDENNTSVPKGYSLDLWQYDLCVETEQLTLGNEKSLIVNVTNDGFIPSVAGTLKTAYGASHTDVDTYAEIELPGIEPGETVSFIVDLTDEIYNDEEDSGLVTAWVETEGNDFCESNNYATTAIAVFEDTEVFYDEELVQIAPELTPDAATVDLAAVSAVQISVDEHRNIFSYVADLDASNYTYSNSVLTLKNDFLAGLTVGTYTLSLVFNANEENETTQFFTLIVEDTTPAVLEGEIAIEGEAVFGSSLTINTEWITSEAPEYEFAWYRGDQLISEEDSYMITADDIGQEVFAVVRGVNTCSGTLYSNVVVPAKSNGQTLFSPTAKYIGYYTIELVPCEGYEYSFNSGEWTDETIFGDLTPNTGYVFRMRKAETNVTTAGAPSDEVNISTLGLPVEGTIQINGVPERGKTLTAVLADYGDSTFTYQWYRNNEPISGATEGSYLLTVDDVNAEVYVKAIGSGEYAGELISDAVTVTCVHEYTWTVTEESTCKKNGTKVGVCICGDRKEDSLPLKDHVPYTSREAQEATCTEAGNTVEIKCRNCDDVLTAATVINPTGHRYGEWFAVDENTHRRFCQNDDSHVETENHVWSENIRETAPTCTTNGERVYTCTVCNGTKIETINRLNHNYEVARRREATCTQPGEIVYVCKNDSSHTYTETIPKFNHIDNNHDGYCDYGCGTAMGEPSNPSDQGDICKYCGKVHTGPLGGILKFFHNIAYFFAHLFGRK